MDVPVRCEPPPNAAYASMGDDMKGLPGVNCGRPTPSISLAQAYTKVKAMG